MSRTPLLDRILPLAGLETIFERDANDTEQLQLEPRNLKIEISPSLVRVHQLQISRSRLDRFLSYSSTFEMKSIKIWKDGSLKKQQLICTSVSISEKRDLVG